MSGSRGREEGRAELGVKCGRDEAKTGEAGEAVKAIGMRLWELQGGVVRVTRCEYNRNEATDMRL